MAQIQLCTIEVPFTSPGVAGTGPVDLYIVTEVLSGPDRFDLPNGGAG